jgi:protein-S-isoprenylcysteine O-methyltransferase Ste14
MNGQTRRLGPVVAKRMLQISAVTAGWSALLFACAGRLDWPRGWICLAVYLFGIAVTAILTIWKNPDVIAARARLHADAKGFDKLFTALYAPLVFVVPAVAGLDAVRFRWSWMPFQTVWPGVFLYLLATVPVVWAMTANPFLETQVRIQTDRGHRVIATGPYRLVRHPMYVGVILQNIATPLILGSGWAYVPVAVVVALFLWRTAREDRTLRNELAGYEEYARRTRYRLLPGVW